ncbi:equilibrative nucleobase transporter 1-like isoform X1 [Saccostrea cucullata]|uniref:equilibrative nucleobase transporter 1-like isoform X1 n=1 Tax=Saccostrea cuccullata TaxID=36930 RepID=UPI002ED143D3
MKGDTSFETIDTYVSEYYTDPDTRDDKLSKQSDLQTASNINASAFQTGAERVHTGEKTMDSCCCNKRHVTFVWALLECLFFTGVIFGWVWLTVTLRRDAFFLDLCNVTFSEEDISNGQSLSETIQDSSRNGRRSNCRTTSTTTLAPQDFENRLPFNGTQYFCDEQEDRLNLLYDVIIIIRNVLILPVGIFLDKYGTTRSRLLTVFTFITGTLMMTFSSTAPWLLIPALVLVSLAGLVLLITNLQVANLFGEYRYTVMATFIGAYHSCSLIMGCMKATNDLGVGTQTSFMFLTIAIVPILVSTIAFLPKSRIPWPLPVTYGTNRVLNGGCVKSKNSRDSKNREDFAAFKNVTCSSLFGWSLVWFGIQYLREFLYDENFRLLFIRLGTDKEQINTEYARLYSSLKMLGLPVAPVLGYLLDWKKLSSYSPPRIQTMHRILFLVVLSSALALLNSILPFVPSVTIQIAGFVLQIIERVSVLVCICSFLTHVHFPIEHLGKYIGCHFLVASLTSLSGFAFQRLIQVNLENNFFYINLVLLVLLLISCVHPINIWNHCRHGFIQDASESNYDGDPSPQENLMSVPNSPSSV